MEEAQIVIAMKKFLRTYAWDKSLSPTSPADSSQVASSRPPDVYLHTSGAQALEEFVNASRK